MAIETSLSIWAHVEYLGKLEGVVIIHSQSACYEDKHASVDWPFLNILAVNLVLYCLEAERFNLVLNVFDSLVKTSVVGHRAIVVVEVEEVASIFHNS